MVKIGLLGVGHLGEIHLKLLKEVRGFDLIGFFDTNASRCKEIENTYDLKCYSSAEQLIKEADALDIVTPTPNHFEYASLGLKSSKHLFIEKPLANSIEEGKILTQLHSEANTKVQVGHVERFNPAYSAALEFCENPMFIEAHRLAEFNPRGTDVSVVLDLMIHDIDIILSLVKSNIKRISASGVAVVSDTPDIANARIEFDNGCVANLTSSRISLKNMRKVRLFQANAYISIDLLEKNTEVIKLKQIEGEADPLAVTIDLGKEKGVKQIYFEHPKIVESNAIKSELEAFLKSINEDTTPVVDIF